MEKQLLNLTLPIVIEEVENILETYPKYPYQQIFSASGLRQDLVAYVLSHVPNKYAVVEEAEVSSNQILLSPYPTKQLLEIEHYINLGIRDILSSCNQDNSDMLLRPNFKFNHSSLAS